MFKRFLLLICFFAHIQAAFLDMNIETENSKLIQDVISNFPELNQLKKFTVRLETDREIELLSNFKDFFCARFENDLLINQKQFNTLTQDEKRFAVVSALFSKKKFSIDRDDHLAKFLVFVFAIVWYALIINFNFNFSIIDSKDFSILYALGPLSLPIFLLYFTVKIAGYILPPLLAIGLFKLCKNIINDVVNDHELKDQDIKAAKFMQNLQVGISFLNKRKAKIEAFLQEMRAMKDDLKADLETEISSISERIKNLENQPA